jgi:hypothetical protein
MQRRESGAWQAAFFLPDFNKFPSLHSLFLNHSRHCIMDQLLKAVINIHGSNIRNILQYCKGYNTDDTHINLPSYRFLKNYGEDLMKSIEI